jgi:hypothetical protein
VGVEVEAALCHDQRTLQCQLNDIDIDALTRIFDIIAIQEHFIIFQYRLAAAHVRTTVIVLTARPTQQVPEADRHSLHRTPAPRAPARVVLHATLVPYLGRRRPNHLALVRGPELPLLLSVTTPALIMLYVLAEELPYLFIALATTRSSAHGPTLGPTMSHLLRPPNRSGRFSRGMAAASACREAASLEMTWILRCVRASSHGRMTAQIVLKISGALTMNI